MNGRIDPRHIRAYKPKPFGTKLEEELGKLGVMETVEIRGDAAQRMRLHLAGLEDENDAKQAAAKEASRRIQVMHGEESGFDQHERDQYAIEVYLRAARRICSRRRDGKAVRDINNAIAWHGRA